MDQASEGTHRHTSRTCIQNTYINIQQQTISKDRKGKETEKERE